MLQFVGQFLLTVYSVIIICAIFTANTDVITVMQAFTTFIADILSLSGPICLFATRFAWERWVRPCVEWPVPLAFFVFFPVKKQGKGPLQSWGQRVFFRRRSCAPGSNGHIALAMFSGRDTRVFIASVKRRVWRHSHILSQPVRLHDVHRKRWYANGYAQRPCSLTHLAKVRFDAVFRGFHPFHTFLPAYLLVVVLLIFDCLCKDWWMVMFWMVKWQNNVIATITSKL